MKFECVKTYTSSIDPAAWIDAMIESARHYADDDELDNARRAVREADDPRTMKAAERGLRDLAGAEIQRRFGKAGSYASMMRDARAQAPALVDAYDGRVEP
jgi:hypothetical protein